MFVRVNSTVYRLNLGSGTHLVREAISIRVVMRPVCRNHFDLMRRAEFVDVFQCVYGWPPSPDGVSIVVELEPHQRVLPLQKLA